MPEIQTRLNSLDELEEDYDPVRQDGPEPSGGQIMTRHGHDSTWIRPTLFLTRPTSV